MKLPAATADHRSFVADGFMKAVSFRCNSHFRGSSKSAGRFGASERSIMQRFLERTQLDSISSRSINDTFSANGDVVLLVARKGREGGRMGLKFRLKTRLSISTVQMLVPKSGSASHKIRVRRVVLSVLICSLTVLPVGLFRGARSFAAYSRVPVKGYKRRSMSIKILIPRCKTRI